MGMNSTTSGVMSFNMDVATGSFRIDANTTSSDDPKNPQVETVLFSGKAKRMYINTIDPSPRATQGCQFIELPSLSEPSKYVACVESLLQQDKKYFDDIYVVKDGVPKKRHGTVFDWWLCGSGYLDQRRWKHPQGPTRRKSHSARSASLRLWGRMASNIVIPWSARCQRLRCP